MIKCLKIDGYKIFEYTKFYIIFLTTMVQTRTKPTLETLVKGRSYLVPSSNGFISNNGVMMTPMLYHRYIGWDSCMFAEVDVLVDGTPISYSINLDNVVDFGDENLNNAVGTSLSRHQWESSSDEIMHLMDIILDVCQAHLSDDDDDENESDNESETDRATAA